MPKKKDGAPAKRRGNRTDVVGARAEHLLGELDGYCNASTAGKTRTWYPGFFQRYWTAFPWNIPFGEDPTQATLAATPKDNTLTEDEKAEKKKIVEETEAKIKRWLNYQRTHSGGGINPWSKWLAAALRSPEDERRPRRLLDYQVYMQDEQKNAAVNAALAERYPDKVGASDSIKWRAVLARELLAAEPEEVQDEFRVRGEEEYEEAMEEFRKIDGKGGGGDDFDENARAEARARLVGAVKPLLLSIRKLTGYQGTLLVGGVINGKMDVRSVHGGTVDGKNEDGPDGEDFTRWDPEGYKPVVKQFMRYITAANGTPQTIGVPSAAAVPEGGAEGPLPPASVPPIGPLAPPAPSLHLPAMPFATPPPPSSQPATGAPPPSPPSPAAGIVGNASTLRARNPSAERTGDGEIDVDMAVPTPTREMTPAEFRGLGIGPPLQRALLELTPGTRQLRIHRLGRMSEYDRTREENMARNKEILASCGVTKEVAVLMQDVRRDMKRGPPEGGGAAAKRARVGEAGDDSGYEDGDGSDSEDGGSQSEGEGVPWASDAHVALLAGGGGESWLKIVNWWWDYETKANYTGPSKGKGTTKRPKEVSAWISRARTGGPVPAIIDVFSFASRWWVWWVEINPSWRKRTGDVVQRLSKEGDGDWASVASSGPNGMLNILICLRWWYDAVVGDEGGMAGWKEAIEDVEWALERIW
ncbi:hypothetical protein C8F04DRAFT_1268411 [Mycena alexandri]|uniref:Uncharacterized protein n=1 Tax=Mycena alexandri TaxID=1745969 RepID=A0AAD6SEU9_9AGAR|nr:hypothetical protein C8F04DRAFT_1268411 [Mycena alexandri]